MYDILHQFRIASQAQKVFDAFTSPAQLNNWWPLRSDGQPKMGEMYTLYFGPEYDWRAEVIHVVPGKEFTWKMTQAMDDWMNTEVGIRLKAENSGTTVDFFHTGWREAGDHYRISNYCWGTLLNGLKMWVEKGMIVPFEERN